MQGNIKRKVLVFIDQMSIGGAARVTSIMANELVEYGYTVTIACDNIKYPIDYTINKNVRIVSFHKKRNSIPIVSSLWKEFSLIALSREIIKSEKPDVIIAVTYMVFSQVYFGSIGLGIPVIAYDHTSFSRNLGFIGNIIRFHLYKQANQLVVLTNKDQALLQKRNFHNTTVIYNPLTYPEFNGSSHRGKFVLCVGRLNSWKVKGFDRIISIWKDISREVDGWKLKIAGDGSESSIRTLETMIKNNSVESSVELLGAISDMENLYRSAGIFALPSRVEGFPMVLMEALSQGCPSISFSIGGAIDEMVDNNKTGLIINDNDINDFEAKLKLLMSDGTMRTRLGENASKSVGRFCRDNYMKSIHAIILKSININQ